MTKTAIFLLSILFVVNSSFGAQSCKDQMNGDASAWQYCVKPLNISFGVLQTSPKMNINIQSSIDVICTGGLVCSEPDFSWPICVCPDYTDLYKYCNISSNTTECSPNMQCSQINEEGDAYCYLNDGEYCTKHTDCLNWCFENVCVRNLTEANELAICSHTANPSCCKILLDNYQNEEVLFLPCNASSDCPSGLECYFNSAQCFSNPNFEGECICPDHFGYHKCCSNSTDCPTNMSCKSTNNIELGVWGSGQICFLNDGEFCNLNEACFSNKCNNNVCSPLG